MQICTKAIAPPFRLLTPHAHVEHTHARRQFDAELGPLEATVGQLPHEAEQLVGCDLHGHRFGSVGCFGDQRAPPFSATMNVLRDPQFGVGYVERDWRKHVPENLRNTWDTLAEVDRLRAFIAARQAALEVPEG